MGGCVWTQSRRAGRADRCMEKDWIDPVRGCPHPAGDPLPNRSPPRPPAASGAARAVVFHRDIPHADVDGADHRWVEHSVLLLGCGDRVPPGRTVITGVVVSHHARTGGGMLAGVLRPGGHDRRSVAGGTDRPREVSGARGTCRAFTSLDRPSALAVRQSRQRTNNVPETASGLTKSYFESSVGRRSQNCAGSHVPAGIMAAGSLAPFHYP